MHSGRAPHDGVLGDDVVVVQDAHDVLEQLQQLAVLVAAHLHGSKEPATSGCLFTTAEQTG